MHYYKFNIPDWNLGTGHLTLVEQAVYLRLINHYYDTESPISIDLQPVLRKLRLSGEADVVSQILAEFFVKTDKGYTHKRCEKICKEYKKESKKNRENGAKGGRPRKDAALEETQEKPSGFFSETQSEPTHNPNQELLTNNQEPITNNQEKDKTYPPNPPRGETQLDAFEPDQPENHFPDATKMISAEKPRPEKPKNNRGTRLDPSWQPDFEYFEAARLIHPGMREMQIRKIADEFRDYWISKAGHGATKTDWLATWRNWVRRAKHEPDNEFADMGAYGKVLAGIKRDRLAGRNGMVLVQDDRAIRHKVDDGIWGSS